MFKRARRAKRALLSFSDSRPTTTDFDCPCPVIPVPDRAPSGHWISYILKPAPKGILCEFKFPDSRESTVGYAETVLSPMTNTANLYWRTTGIGKEQLDRMNPQQRAQVENWGFMSGLFGCLGDQMAGLGAGQNFGFTL